MSYDAIPQDLESQKPHAHSPTNAAAPKAAKGSRMPWDEPGTGWASDLRESTPLVKGGLVPTPMLNTSDNVIILYRLNDLRNMSASNYTLAVIILAYVGVEIVLFVLNAFRRYESECETQPGASEASCGQVVTDKAFHFIEFWATVVFATANTYAMVYTPKAVNTIFNRPLYLKVVLFFAVVAAMVPAVLVTVNLEYFEIIAHEIEYANEITLSFLDLVLLRSLMQQSSRDETVAAANWLSSSGILAGVSVGVALCQMFVYNGFGRTSSGDMVGESAAHFLEFSFGILSGLITFWFCVDNKVVADLEIGEIMYGKHVGCLLCKDKSIELTMQKMGSRRPQGRRRKRGDADAED